MNSSEIITRKLNILTAAVNKKTYEQQKQVILSNYDKIIEHRTYGWFRIGSSPFPHSLLNSALLLLRTQLSEQCQEYSILSRREKELYLANTILCLSEEFLKKFPGIDSCAQRKVDEIKKNANEVINNEGTGYFDKIIKTASPFFQSSRDIGYDRLNSNEYYSQFPTHIKPQEEKNGINKAYANITQNFNVDGEQFTPLPRVPYIWAIIPNDTSQGFAMVLGVEEPWKYPKLFVDPTNDKEMGLFKSTIHPRLKQAGKLGHPSLATKFEQFGQSNPHDGQAYIGGEFVLRKGVIYLDNNSGRFGKNDGGVEYTHKLMEYACKELRRCINIETPIKVKIL